MTRAISSTLKAKNAASTSNMILAVASTASSFISGAPVELSQITNHELSSDSISSPDPVELVAPHRAHTPHSHVSHSHEVAPLSFENFVEAWRNTNKTEVFIGLACVSVAHIALITLARGIKNIVMKCHSKASCSATECSQGRRKCCNCCECCLSHLYE